MPVVPNELRGPRYAGMTEWEGKWEGKWDWEGKWEREGKVGGGMAFPLKQGGIALW